MEMSVVKVARMYAGKERRSRSIDVWEGASVASSDASIVGYKSNSVSNARKKIVET